MKTTFLTTCISTDEQSEITMITVRGTGTTGPTKELQFRLPSHNQEGALNIRKMILSNAAVKLGIAILSEAFPEDMEYPPKPTRP